ncbi:MAG TPA: carbon-nitrogen hydrolase family protein [bacterium]|nr:carbon-nitrogen hydrolase family protein [bacterium]HPN33398.1 carbon-nitrogen hydrolase family protein [bacterium]
MNISKNAFLSLVILLRLPTMGPALADSTRSGVLTIAGGQFPVSTDVSANANWILKQMRQAKQKGADIIHFPECALSGYAGVDYTTLAHFDWSSLHAQTQRILAAADSLDLWVLLGSMHRLSGKNKPHNCVYVIDPEGRILDRYDKRFCTDGDLDFFTPGDHLVTFSLNGVSCGVLICFDVRFPELYRAYVREKVDIVFHSFYNARQKKGSIHPMIMPVTCQAHAGINHVFISMTNSSAKHSWPCHFITPDGRIEKKLKTDKPGVLISTVDLGKSYYDASADFRMDAINGKWNSGETVEDERSKNRTTL